MVTTAQGGSHVSTPSLTTASGPRRRGRRLAAVAFALALAGVALAATAIASSSADWRDKVDASVLSAAQAGTTDFFVYLEPKADLSGAEAFRTREAKSRYVRDRLTAVAETSQAPVLAQLDQLGASG